VLLVLPSNLGESSDGGSLSRARKQSLTDGTSSDAEMESASEPGEEDDVAVVEEDVAGQEVVP
jgi:hypothetical protein